MAALLILELISPYTQILALGISRIPCIISPVTMCSTFNVRVLRSCFPTMIFACPSHPMLQGYLALALVEA
jgi:hypothetical protein